MRSQILLSLVLLSALCGISAQLQVLQNWKSYLDYEFPSDKVRQKMIHDGSYIPKNNLPFDADLFERDGVSKTFITIPMNGNGIPATLGTAVGPKNATGNLIRPYPDWSWHSRSDCKGITSVYRVAIDSCNRLWVLDSGLKNLIGPQSRRVCQPQVLAFDLQTDRLLLRYKFPDSVLTPVSRLVTIIVEVRDPARKCDAYVYAVDSGGFGIIVFDTKRRRSWRVSANSMFPYPPYGRFNIDGVVFDLMEGVEGIALGPLKGGDRTLFYHALSSVVESWVPASIVKNESLFPSALNMAPDEFRTSKNGRPSQAETEDFDENGIMYFSPLSENAIYCWNPNEPYEPRNLHQLIRDDTVLQYVNTVKIKKNQDGDEIIYLFSNRLQKSFTQMLDSNDINFRVVVARLKDLTQGTPCEN